MKKIYKAKVNKIEQVSATSHYIEIECDAPVKVEAGQFISIYCDGLTLRRPFSIYSNNDGKIGVLFKERGKGTQYIKSLKVGDFIDIAGPFGNTFDIQNKKSLLIGAGIGAAPMAYLKEKLDEQGIENYYAAGFLNKDDSISYELRMWIDYNATNEVMNKKFESAVTIISTSPQ